MEELHTQDEEAALREMGYGYPQEEEKQNIFSFFKRVIAMKDTTRTGNLTEPELGLAKIPARTWLELHAFCEAAGLEGLGKHFQKESQILTNTSLSKEGFLDKLAVTQKRELEKGTKGARTKKGWFSKEPKQQGPDSYYESAY